MISNSAEPVEIKAAIRKGMLTINYPVLVIMIAGLFVVGLPLAWLYWAYAIPKWKLWAYARVNDVSALKDAAMEAGLIWPDDHIFEKTEICSKAKRQKILELEGRAG